MVLNTNFEMVNGIAKITLQGKLDASATSIFKAEVEKAVANRAKRLILFVKDLEYVSSSGLRVLIYFKQKMGPLVDIYIISPQPFIKEVLQITGFYYGVNILEEYDEKIEKLEETIN